MDLYSNCMSDYAENALSVVFDQIVRKVGQSYQIDMDPENDILYKVYFEMDSGEIVDVAKSLYEVNNAVITFKSERVLDGVSKVHTDIIKPIKELVEAAQQAKAQ